MLFVRDFAGFTGGHMKFATYLRHTAASGLANAVLYQTPQSRTVPDNIFNDHDGPTTAELRPFPAYFVSGEDWFILDGAGIDPTGAPVINLIQDFRYADPKHPLHTCLGRRALRICVSDALAEAVRQRANGEVHVIENGIELSEVPTRRPLAAPARVLVAGLKNPEVARALAARLDGLAEIDLLTEPLPRLIFLARMAEASVCVLLPLEQEGFFLPPLEAMALGRCIVTVDCYGNRAYCRPGENCLMPVYDAGALAAAVLALVHDGAQMEQLAAGGLKTAAEHSIEKERAAYHALLARHLGSRS
jgi:hypothetical protein